MDLTKASHSELAIARRAPDADQKMLAPAEHRAFAREWTRERPLLAPASLAVAIPAYTLAKTLGIVKARSPASLKEMVEGFKGIADGLKSEKAPKPTGRIPGSPSPYRG